MDTKFITSDDGLRIAYDIHGSGPTLLLLHGFSNNRKLWSTYDWVNRLQSQFTVITIDLRGCGESGGRTETTAYTLEHHLTDIQAVVNACQANPFQVWGWSFGATIGLHLAASSSQVLRAVIGGTCFGRIFTEDYIQSQLEKLEPLAEAQAEGKLDQLGLSAGVLTYWKNTDLAVYLTRVKSLSLWPMIEPQNIQCPTLVYSGTADKNVIKQLRKQRAAIEAAGLQLQVFDGLTHLQLVSEVDKIYPVVCSFLVTV